MVYCFRGCPPPSLFLRSGRCPPLTWGSQNPPLSYNEWLPRLFPVTSTGVWTRWTELYFTSCCHLKSRVYIVDLYKSDILRPAYPSMTGGIIIVWGLGTQARKRLPLASCPSRGEPIRHFHISHNAPYLPPKILYKQALLSISLGTAVIPRRNEKQRFCKI